ncbi:MAG TPA: ABC transporter ATP-binding protein [Clostridiales bacterium]|nr:ABC transporter ATP-binding protein [Clostridiales bacterium]
MIEAVKVSKRFDTIQAVDQVSVTVKEGNVFGLIGTNGAGKSSFIRMLCGIIRPDSGSITFDGQKVYENVETKRQLFYISDEQYYFSNSTPKELRQFYQVVYPGFDVGRFGQLLGQFELDANRKISTFSKGMKKQLSILCGICANTKYLFCDETFDGLDPVIRQAVKSIFAKEIAERNMTVIIASHNLRELEDICDHVGLMHKGGILLSKELFDMKLNIHKVQCVFGAEADVGRIFQGMEVLKTETRGSLYTITVRGTAEEVEKRMEKAAPVFSEVIPLSLEEIFVSETEVVGYDIKKLIY